MAGDSESPKKLVRDEVELIKKSNDVFKTKVEEAGQSIETIEKDFKSLREMNDKLRQICRDRLDVIAKSNPQQHHHTLTDDDTGEIDSKRTNIQTANLQLLELLGTVKRLLNHIGQEFDSMYSKLKSVDEQIRHHKISLVEFSGELTSVHNSLIKSFESLNPSKDRLMMLLRDIDSYQEEISSWKYGLVNPEIITIPLANLQALWAHLSAPVNVDTSGTIPILQFADDIHKILEIYQLQRIVERPPMTDVTVIECLKRIQFAFWKLNKEGMETHGNRWATLFGEVMDQLDHEICWAITSAELVSAIRHLEGLDVPRIDYSAQFLVDFADSDLRGVKRQRPGVEHFCYPFTVEAALEYVRKHGIETQEARPLVDTCNQKVEPLNSSKLGYIDTVKKMDTVEETLKVVERHPVAASIPIFEPEYADIEDKIYRGPTSRISRYHTMHAGNITGGGEENGEKYVWFRSSHGDMMGVCGYLKVSIEVMAMCITRGIYEGFIEHPFPLLTAFVYPTMLSKEEDERRKEEDERKRKNASRKEEVRSGVAMPSQKVGRKK